MRNKAEMNWTRGGLLFLLCSLMILCACVDVHQKDEKRASALIDQLASPVPPKYTNGETDLPTMDIINDQIDPQVATARSNLVAMGTKIYPELMKHRDDKRYCYSTVVADWENQTVGYMVVDIMADGIEFHGYEYKSRKYPPGGGHGAPCYFDFMVREIGYEKYAEHAKSRTKEELQVEYIKWCIEQERRSGFVSKQQEAEILGPYLKRLSELTGTLDSQAFK